MEKFKTVKELNDKATELKNLSLIHISMCIRDR